MIRAPTDRTVARWQSQLRHFSFHRAAGGHANDCDTLLCVLPFEGEAGLVALLAKLEFTLTVIPEGAPRIVVGRSYSPAEWDQLYHPIRAYPRFAEPGATQLFGLRVHLSVGMNTITVGAFGAAAGSWTVVEEDFRNALKLEAEFDRRGVVPKFAR